MGYSRKINEIINIFNSRAVETSEYKTRAGRDALGYVCSDGAYFSISEDRKFFSENSPSFLEIGCGFGNNTLRAALVGYDAFGIDILGQFVDVGNKLIADLKSEGIIDPSLKVQLFSGNFMDKETIGWYKENWAKESSRALRRPAFMVKNIMEAVSEDELEVLTESEFRKVISNSYEYYPVRKLELPPGRRALLKEGKDRNLELLSRVYPRMILANIYEPDGKDVYDTMGKEFGDFDAFYYYPWGPEQLPFTKMLVDRHPTPYKVYKYGDGDSIYTGQKHEPFNLKGWLRSCRCRQFS